MEAVIYLVAAAFAGMGVVGLAKPQFIMDIFGVQLTLDGRNEVRAVYGGFGVFIAGALVWALQSPRYAAGIILAVAIALAGMAAGRVVSLLIERPGVKPIALMVMEIATAAALYFSIPRDTGINLNF